MSRHVHVWLHRGTDDAFEESEHPRGQPKNAGQFAKKSEVDPKVHAYLQKKGFSPTEGEEAKYKHSSGHEIGFEPNRDTKSPYAYSWRHSASNGSVNRGYGKGTLANQIGKISSEGAVVQKAGNKVSIPEHDDQKFKEALKLANADAYYSEFPVEKVPLNKIVQGYPQSTVSESVVNKNINKLKRGHDFGDHPYVVEHGGTYYLLDGYHRTEAALRSGMSNLSMHVEHV